MAFCQKGLIHNTASEFLGIPCFSRQNPLNRFPYICRWNLDTHLVVQVDLDAILSRAEMREEEEEVPQSEANKELLAAFKCTTLTFEETEKDMEMEGRK